MITLSTYCTHAALVTYSRKAGDGKGTVRARDRTTHAGVGVDGLSGLGARLLVY